MILDEPEHAPYTMTALANCNERIDSKGLEEGKGRICSKDNNESDLTGLDVADADRAVVVVNGKMWQGPARGQIGFSKMFNPLCNFLLLFLPWPQT